MLCYRPVSARTGSSLAARRAGSTPNSSPVATATPTAASGAQSGAAIGKTGNSCSQREDRDRGDQHAERGTGAGQQNGFDQKQPQHLSFGCAECLQQPDLGDPLRDGHQHHVHDQDPGDRQADGGDARHRIGQRAQDAVEGVEQRVLGDDGDVVLAVVAFADDVTGGLLCARNVFLAACLDQDAEQGGCVEQALCRGHRDHHHVVEILPQRFAAVGRVRR